MKGDLSRAAAALLPYYEAAYSHQIARCSGRFIATIDVGEQPPTQIAHEALRFAMAASVRVKKRMAPRSDREELRRNSAL